MDEASSGTPSDDVAPHPAEPAEDAPDEDPSAAPAGPVRDARWEDGLTSVRSEAPNPDDLSWDDLPVALGEEVEDPSAPQPKVQEADADDDGGDPGDSDDGGDLGDSGDSGDGDDPGDSDDGGDGGDGGDLGDSDDGGDLGELDDADQIAGRRNALPRRVESWRSRSASGAIATALAMGLQQVFEPEKRRPAAVAEAPSNPYADDDPITVEYVPDDAESTKVHVKPWLLEKGDPA